MTKFITNIELEHGSEKDYSKLNRELEKSCFRREYYASLRVPVMLGYQTFTKVGDVGLKDIDHEVSKAATATGRKFSFFVIRSKS